MKKTLFALIMAVVFVGSFAQNWTIYNTSNSDLPNNFITAINQDASGNLWIGSYNKITQQANGGLVIIEPSGTQTVYNTSNSQIPSNNIRAIACDGTIVWIGTDKGLTRFVGGSFTTFNSTNSGLFYNDIYGIDVDANGNVWLATWRGISMFDGTNWQFWITENSNLSDNHFTDITVDNNGNVYASNLYNGVFKYNAGDWDALPTGLTGYWDFNKIYQTIPTQTGLITAGFHGIGIYDGSTWTSMDSISTDFSDRTALSATIQADTVWFTTKKGGISKYDINNDNWTILNTSNSQIPGDWGDIIFTDNQGNIVIGTDEGLVYIDYTTTNINSINNVEEFNIYPNPATDNIQLIINNDQLRESVNIFDVAGKIILSIDLQNSVVNQSQSIDISKLQRGIYFIKVDSQVQKFIKK